MTRQLLLCLYLISFPFINWSQTYGNEWINYSQKYYSFKIAANGLYRIDYTTFAASNIPITTINTANIQLFAREKQVPLLIQDGNDGVINPGDYILFYAEKNDGWLDETLYDTPSDVGNPKYSLYNDTINYFFSWNSTGGNSRFLIETSTDINNYSSSSYILAEKFQFFTSNYNEGEKISDASSSFYTPGEGWGNSPVNGGGTTSGYTWNYGNIVLENLFQGTNAPDIRYRSVIVGSSNANYTGIGNHHTIHTIGNANYVLADSIFSGYRAIHIDTTFSVSTLPSSGVTNFKIKIQNDQGALTDYQSINYWSFIYPKTPNLQASNNAQFWVKPQSGQSKARIDITNTTASQPIILSLGTIPRKLQPVYANGGVSFLLPNSADNSDQKIIFSDINQIGSIGQLKAVNGFGYFTDFSQLNVEKALLMVYHPSLSAAATDYKNYRNSGAGGSYNSILANVSELYFQFGGGIEKHINGIRRFAQYMYDQSTEKPVGLFLMERVFAKLT